MKSPLFEHVGENQFALKTEIESHHGGHAQAYLDANSGNAAANAHAWRDEQRRKSGKEISIVVNKKIKDKQSFIKFLQLLVKSSDTGDITVTFQIDNSIYIVTKTDIYAAGG